MEPFATIGVPIDSVGRCGGTERAPEALRGLGIAAAVRGGDRGDMEVSVRGETRDPVTGILASADVLAATAAVRSAVADAIPAGPRPFLVGGCCALLPGALAGARDAMGGVGLVYLDGHQDLYDGATSPTGEAADMPVAVALGFGPRAWVQACGGASVRPERVALVGYRDAEESIAHGMAQPGEVVPALSRYPVESVRADGPATVAKRAVAAVGGRFWLHFDVDVLDEDVFPATDYLMPGGLSWDELADVLAPLISSSALIGASLACYNPEKDVGGDCARRLVETLRAAMGPGGTTA